MDDNGLRIKEDIITYLDEASYKVWLMRTHKCDNPEMEKTRLEAIGRIIDAYDDIPEGGYTDWECGYLNGIMSALRWVLGDEKDNLDT